jgi:hypothetical protein
VGPKAFTVPGPWGRSLRVSGLTVSVIRLIDKGAPRPAVVLFATAVVPLVYETPAPAGSSGPAPQHGSTIWSGAAQPIQCRLDASSVH